MLAAFVATDGGHAAYIWERCATGFALVGQTILGDLGFLAGAKMRILHFSQNVINFAFLSQPIFTNCKKKRGEMAPPMLSKRHLLNALWTSAYRKSF